tara:strand:+ start:106 stop:576 length:471 start_codon:yes stop_codon:yes gene_type:complete
MHTNTHDFARRNQVQNAINVASEALAGQRDKAGQPLWHHAADMAKTLLRTGQGELAAVVAALHDVLEDSTFTPEQLREAITYPTTHLDEVLVVDLVNVLTRKSDETYKDYILRIKKSHPVAIAVKIADLQHHLADTTAIPDSLVVRYEKALGLLRF